MSKKKKKKTKRKHPSTKYNWDKIKSVYETGHYNIKELTQKFGKYNNKSEFRTAYSHFRYKLKDVEFDKKKQRELAKTIQKKVFNALGTEEAEIKKEYAKAYGKIKKRIIKESLKEKPSASLLRNLKTAMQSLEICRKEEFEAYEIQEVAKKIENDIGLSSVDGIEISIE